MAGAQAQSERFRRGVTARFAWSLFALALLVILGFAAWNWRSWEFRAATDKALRRLSGLHDAADIRAALALWEEETGKTWRGRERPYTEYLLKHSPPSDAAARHILSYVSGADFGDRLEHWQRWLALEERLKDGKQPQTNSKEAISLVERWQASIGLTTRGSTILPIDGSIFVGSCGSALEDADDPADGVVRVNASNGDAEIIFQSPDRPPRDVVGLVAGNQELIVACRNGYVYGIDSKGKLLRWKAYAGSKITSAPLGLEINNDSNLDVVVVTEAGKVVGLGGGRVLWSVPLELPARPKFDAELLGADAGGPRAALAFGPLPGTANPALLVTTWAGFVAALSPTNGKTYWHLRVPTGLAAAPMLLPPETPNGVAGAYLLDVGGTAWSLLRGERQTTATSVWNVATAIAADAIAPLRIAEDAEGNVGLLGVAFDQRGRAASSLCWLAADGVRWRCPIDGVVRTPPAVADLSGDGAAEAIVVSSLPMDGNGPYTLLTVVSSNGFVLRRFSLDEAVEAAPVAADVDGDGKLDVLIADRSGRLHCYTAERFGAVYWGPVGGDPRGANNTADAFTFGQTPNGYQWQWTPGRARKK